MKNKKGLLLIFTGLLLIAAALFLTVYNRYEEHRAAEFAVQVIDRLDAFLPAEKDEIIGEESCSAAPTEDVSEIEIPDYILNPNMEMPVQTIDGRAYIGILKIPALELELPIISEWSYPNLKVSPCRYAGSVYTNDLVIAAHNYEPHFGNVKNLSEGDTITFTDMDGNVFTYVVAAKETLPPAAGKEMTSGDWPLTLFTCTLSGSARVTIRCDLADEAG